jgi:ribulose-5-phosphate 4-epimerase/fuculose-1-phosphate aldolase
MSQVLVKTAEHHAREEMCRVGRSLFERGYVHATAGNISVRLDHGFLITPTDACLGFLDPNDLALLDANGVQLSGARASKTWALHRRIYSATQTLSPATACVIHSHSTHLVALSLKNKSLSTSLGPELLAPITPYFVMKVGHVPLIPYHKPGDVASADEVENAIRRYAEQGLPLHAVMLSRLGPNVWHDSPSQAMATLEELEETARLSLMVDTEPLNESSIDELRQTFGASW